MITVSFKMNTTADRFYDLLMNSVKHDIEQKNETFVDLKDIKSGYVYDKRLTNKFGKQGAAKTILTKVEHPYCYEAQFETSRGVNTVSYQIEALGEGLIEVTYSENYDPIDKVSDLNHKLMNFFYKRSTRKRMLQLLKQMNQHLQIKQ